MTNEGFSIHVQFIVAPGWFTALSWAILIMFMALATIWVCQRASRRRQGENPWKNK